LGYFGRKIQNYDLTTQVLKALGFLHNVLVDQFRIQGDLAKIIIEKMPWKPDEIKLDGSDAEYNIPLAKQSFLLSVTRPFQPTRRKIGSTAIITETAYYTDEGIILIDLGTDEPLVRLFGRDSEHYATLSEPLWNLKVTEFDYGLIKGYFDGEAAHLSCFPR